MLIQGTCFKIPLASKSVHCVVTSPPYWGLRKYAGEQGDEPLGLEATPERHIERTVDWAREIYRILRDDGVFYLNYGDCYDSGTQFNNHSGLEEADRYNQLSESKKWAGHRSLIGRAGNLMLMPHRIALALQEPFMQCKGCGKVAHQIRWGRFPNGRWICPSCEKSKGWTEETPGWIVRQDLIWHKPNPMPESVAGWRWERSRTKIAPSERGREDYANAYDAPQGDHKNGEIDGSAEYEYGDDYILRKGSWRHTRAHEYVFMLVKDMQYWSNQEAVREASLARYDYDFNKVGKGIDGSGASHKKGAATETIKPNSGRNPRSVLRVPTAPYKGAHYATFPPNLIAPLIRASCPRWACPECGQGWSPVVERSGGSIGHSWHDHGSDDESGMSQYDSRFQSGGVGNARDEGEKKYSVRVVAYRLTCEHEHTKEEAVPGIVFDPFVGSGTTVMVANELLRRGIGLDVSKPYLAEQASVRTGAEMPLDQQIKGLPMFDGFSGEESDG